MTRPAPQPAIAALALVAAIALAGCGGAAQTPSATPVPTIAPAATPAATAAPTAEPTEAPATAEPTPEPTPEPTLALATPEAGLPGDPAPGTFRFSYGEIVAYYESVGYTCADTAPSAVAAGYFLRLCSIEGDGLPTKYVGFLIDENGELGDIFAAALNAPGGEMPTTMELVEPLAFILGVSFSEADAELAATWLAENLGSEMAETQVNGNTVYTYTGNDDTGVGAYVEVATPAYLAAPQP